MIFTIYAKKAGTQLNILTNEFLYNKKSKPDRYQNFPAVCFAIPVTAYRVSYVKHVNPDNIVEQTIFKLKKIGYSNGRIADTLCLDERLVNSVLEYYGQATTTEGKTETKDSVKNAYVFYDRLRGKFLREYAEEDDFAENTQLYLVDRRKNSFKFKINFSDSRDYFVHILHGDYKEPPAAPSQEDIISVIGKTQGEVISSERYSNGEYLNEQKEIFLICEAYLDKNDFTDISITNPVFGATANYLKLALEKAVNAFPEENGALKKDIGRLKARAYDEAESVDEYLSEVDKKVADELLKRYGKAVKQYKDVYLRLFELEKSFIAYNSAMEQRGSAADCVGELSSFQTCAYSLLETVFIRSYYKYASEETLLKYGRVTRDNSKPELLRAQMHNLGFDCSNSADVFLKGVSVDELRKIFESTKKPDYIRERINLWVAANAMCGTVDDGHPIRELARLSPKLIDALTSLLGMRNPAAHGAAKTVIIGSEQVKVIHGYCIKVAGVMLKLSEINGEIEKHGLNGREARQHVELLVKNKMKDIVFNDPNTENRAEAMCRAYFNRDSKFYFYCSNFLHSVYLDMLGKYYEVDLRDRLVASLPDDVEALRLYMTKIVKSGGADYEIKSKINKIKLTGFLDLEKATLTCVEFLTILFLQEKDPLAFGRFQFKELLQLTDTVVEKRGHSTSADFNKDGKECELLLDGLLKLTSNQGE